MPITHGSRALIKVAGAPVAFTSEPTVANADGKTYQLSSASVQGLPWEPTTSITVRQGGSSAGVDAYSLYRLNGTVVFATSSTSRQAVTVSGSYLPMSSAANANEFALHVKADIVKASVFGDTWLQRARTLLDVRAEFGEYYASNQYLNVLSSSAQQVVVLEIWASTGTTYDARSWGLLSQPTESGKVTGLVDAKYQFEGAPDNENRAVTFSTAGA